MIPGIGLLALLGAAVAFIWIRLRRRLGLGVHHRHWLIAGGVLAVAVAALWVTAR